jgi:hypothetical protein
MAQMSPRIANISDARRHLEDNQFNQQALANALEDAERNQAEEGHFERLQGDLDRQTLARMGQQHEADEMEAMGVPPMSRTLGGTPPANLGRAGSTGENENIEPSNPFPKPIGQNVRGDLMNWAAGAGREAGKPDIVDRTYDEGGSQFDLSQMYDDAEESEYEDEPLHENNPAKHSITSTTLRASPRQQKRGQMDSGRNEFRRPGDESSKRMNPSQRLLQQMMQMNAQKEAGF